MPGTAADKMFACGLYLVALHSVCVGLVLLLMPAGGMLFFGFDPMPANFFRAQAGVFHLLIAGVYVMAAHTYRSTGALVYFAVAVKLVAAVFLVSYYVFVKRIWAVGSAGVLDLALGLLMLAGYAWAKGALPRKQGKGATES